MKLLLDTHALLWWLSADENLSRPALDAIAAPGNEVFVSAASAWEIARKNALGKLPGVEALVDGFEANMANENFASLPISTTHMIRAARYHSAHRDPFDRILAAQADLDGLTLVSRDAAIDGFGITRLW
jgi:PIN domain nuclease of toxin-antitoxin system